MIAEKITILERVGLALSTKPTIVEAATAGLLEGLQKYVDEFKFHIFALSRDIKHHRIEPRNGMAFHFLAIPSRWYVKPNVIPNILNARTGLKKVQADVVHCQDNMALAIGAMSTQPARRLFTVHGIKYVVSRLWEGPQYWSPQMDTDSVAGATIKA